jgi:DNA-binding HxlR family transcriptional regulator
MNDTNLDQLVSLFKALADPARLRILGLLAERPHFGHELAERLNLTPPTISHHMRRLTDAGLIDVTPDAQARIYTLREQVLREMSQAIGGVPAPLSSASEDEAVLRAFFDGARLRSIPAARKKRVVVLRHLLAGFAPGREYHEREVNDILREAHDDVATLRRELVDYGFMTRDRGIYRIASELPNRGANVKQEVGDEQQWFKELVAGATARAIADQHQVTGRMPPAPPPQSRRS